jgi:hypothetical protein
MRTMGMTKAIAVGLAVLAMEAPSVRAETVPNVAEWKVSVLIQERYETCDGGRGTVRMKDNKLSFFGQGMLYPAWEIDLLPDGSADNTIGTYIHSNRLLRVKVWAGTGPRMITTMSEISLCAFKYVPD